MTPQPVALPDAVTQSLKQLISAHASRLDEQIQKNMLEHLSQDAYDYSRGLVAEAESSVSRFLRNVPGLKLDDKATLLNGVLEIFQEKLKPKKPSRVEKVFRALGRV